MGFHIKLLLAGMSARDSEDCRPEGYSATDSYLLSQIFTVLITYCQYRYSSHVASGGEAMIPDRDERASSVSLSGIKETGAFKTAILTIL